MRARGRFGNGARRSVSGLGVRCRVSARCWRGRDPPGGEMRNRTKTAVTCGVSPERVITKRGRHPAAPPLASGTPKGSGLGAVEDAAVDRPRPYAEAHLSGFLPRAFHHVPVRARTCGTCSRQGGRSRAQRGNYEGKRDNEGGHRGDAPLREMREGKQQSPTYTDRFFPAIILLTCCVLARPARLERSGRTRPKTAVRKCESDG